MMIDSWKTVFFAALLAAGLCSPAVGQWLQEPSYTPVTSSQLQAVNSDGSSYFATIHPTSSLYPVQYIGVVVNNPADMEPLYPSAQDGQDGQFQVFVQALPGGTYGGYTVAPGDFGGTALYVGQTVPWNPSENFSDAEWQEDLNFLGASTLTTGDVVLVQANAPGLEYDGKYNVNVQHWNTIENPQYGFSITVLGQTTPAAAAISLASLVQPNGTQIFDPTMATGCEHYKGSLVHLDDLLLTDPGDWGLGNTVTIQQGNLTFPMQVGLDSGLASLNPQTLSTRPFSITAVVDQEAVTGDDTTGFSVWLTNSANLTMAAPGDANGDGRVDINDLTIVLTNYGRTGMTWTQGEFTGDGKVDINDLTIVLTNYGQTAGASARPGAVPEPGALALLLAGAAVAALALRPRRVVRSGT
jgi:uncharacterized protein (DUF2141 family)